MFLFPADDSHSNLGYEFAFFDYAAERHESLGPVRCLGPRTIWDLNSAFLSSCAQTSFYYLGRSRLKMNNCHAKPLYTCALKPLQGNGQYLYFFIVSNMKISEIGFILYSLIYSRRALFFISNFFSYWSPPWVVFQLRRDRLLVVVDLYRQSVTFHLANRQWFRLRGADCVYDRAMSTAWLFLKALPINLGGLHWYATFFHVNTCPIFFCFFSNSSFLTLSIAKLIYVLKDLILDPTSVVGMEYSETWCHKNWPNCSGIKNHLVWIIYTILSFIVFKKLVVQFFGWLLTCRKSNEYYECFLYLVPWW